MIWLTSDQHFGWKNIHNRPFNDTEDMNRTLIRNWNSVVSDNDTVYVLGDFFMGLTENVYDIYPMLKGREIILVRGNHDSKPRMEALLQYPNFSIAGTTSYVTYKDMTCNMRHKPLQQVPKDDVENKRVNLYGHLHDFAPVGMQDDLSFHVGVDTNDWTPVSIEDVYSMWKEHNV